MSLHLNARQCAYVFSRHNVVYHDDEFCSQLTLLLPQGEAQRCVNLCVCTRHVCEYLPTGRTYGRPQSFWNEVHHLQVCKQLLVSRQPDLNSQLVYTRQTHIFQCAGNYSSYQLQPAPTFEGIPLKYLQSVITQHRGSPFTRHRMGHFVF